MCTWTIDIPSATGIHIVFTHFELQDVSLLGQCVDYVEVFDAAGSSQGLIIYYSIVNMLVIYRNIVNISVMTTL